MNSSLTHSSLKLLLSLAGIVWLGWVLWPSEKVATAPTTTSHVSAPQPETFEPVQLPAASQQQSPEVNEKALVESFGIRKSGERNPDINPQSLTTNRLATASMFLRQVTIQPDPRGGFVVQEVDKGSLYAQMGLRAGDKVFTIDTTDNASMDDNSLDAGMQQQHVEMQVYRDGGFVLLKADL